MKTTKKKPQSQSSSKRAKDWRDIQQNSRRAQTPVSRRRAFVNMGRAGVVAAGLLIGVGGVGYGGYFFWSQASQVSPFEREQKLARIVFESDGVLNGSWFAMRSPVKIGEDIFSLDIHAIKREVEKIGQVREAVVSVELPGTLRIRVREQVPVLRALIRGENGAPQTLLIARDGTVYEGSLYPSETLRRLPGVTGVRLVRQGNGYEPLEGIAVIADLVRSARTLAPHLVEDWRWIDLARFNGDTQSPGALIKVHGRYIETLVFSPGNFEDQITRLEDVVSVAQQRGSKGFSHVDLSFTDRAVVRPRNPS